MANSQSAKKRIRQNEKRRQRNQKVRSRISTYQRRFNEALETGSGEEAQEAYREVVSELDIAARKGVIPKKRASRRKSRLAKRLADKS